MIDRLEYLLALAQARHFGRAAKACSVSQPSLSNGLRELEESLGVLLVNRRGRFLGLTPEGERTLKWARRLVGDMRAMQEDVRAVKRGLTGALRIAVIPAAIPSVALLTGPLRTRHPGIDFTILSRPATELTSMLNNLEVDAAITCIDLEPLPRGTAIPIYRERYQLVVAKGSPLNGKKTVTWRKIARLPLCLLTRNTQNRRLIESLLRGAGGSPRVSMESDSLSVLFSHIGTGSWASVMPEKIAQSMMSTGVVQAIPIIEPIVTHTIGLVMPGQEPATPLAVALVEEARRVGARLMKQNASTGRSRQRVS